MYALLCNGGDTACVLYVYFHKGRVPYNFSTKKSFDVNTEH